jgi:hypothetical protein
MKTVSPTVGGKPLETDTDVASTRMFVNVIENGPDGTGTDANVIDDPLTVPWVDPALVIAVTSVIPDDPLRTLLVTGSAGVRNTCIATDPAGLEPVQLIVRSANCSDLPSARI